MFLSQEEMVAVLKKSLPNTKAQDLEFVAKSILDHSKHWQEVDLTEHIHDEVEEKILHDICKRKSKSNESPKKIRLFFKHS